MNAIETINMQRRAMLRPFRLVRIQIIYTLSAGDRRRVANNASRHRGLASLGECLAARQRRRIVILIV